MIHIKQEVQYMQSRLFHRFISDILDKIHNKGLPIDNCKRDILWVVLTQFNVKFS